MGGDPTTLAEARAALERIGQPRCMESIRMSGMWVGDCELVRGHSGAHGWEHPKSDFAVHLATALSEVDRLTAENERLTGQVASYQGALREVATCGICKGYGETGDHYMDRDADGEAYEVDTREPCASCHGTGYDIQHLETVTAERNRLTAELAEAEAENRRLRDVLGWTNQECPGKCGAVAFGALAGNVTPYALDAAEQRGRATGRREGLEEAAKECRELAYLDCSAAYAATCIARLAAKVTP